MTDTQLSKHFEKMKESGFVAKPIGEGRWKVVTSCLHPSFDRISVFIERNGDGFTIHDDESTFDTCWYHNVEKTLIRRILKKAIKTYDLDEEKLPTLSVDVGSAPWIEAAILTIANTASHTAAKIIEKSTPKTYEAMLATEPAIVIEEALKNVKRKKPALQWANNYEIRGESGKPYKFDFMVEDEDSECRTLIAPVASRGVSVSGRFTAFSDVMRSEMQDFRAWAVFGSELNNADMRLMAQVATVFPVAGVREKLLAI